MSDEPPNLELGLELRNQVYEELERLADVAGSYARSIAEAAFRGDQLTVDMHIKQLRLVVLAMIKLYKDGLHGQTLAAGARSARADRQDQQAGDAMGGDQP